MDILRAFETKNGKSLKLVQDIKIEDAIKLVEIKEESEQDFEQTPTTSAIKKRRTYKESDATSV